jgi:hypothetical protein
MTKKSWVLTPITDKLIATNYERSKERKKERKKEKKIERQTDRERK